MRLANEVRLAIRGAEFVLHEIPHDGRTGKASITIPVTSKGLSIRVGPVPLDGGLPQKGIHVPEARATGGILRTGVWVLSFVLEVSIEVAFLEDALITESQADKAQLEKLGSSRPIHVLSGRISLRPTRFPSVDAATLDRLLYREVGLALYSDALRLSTPTGRFRELWRVLESAFGEKDSHLVSSLANYPPAVNLEYNRAELKELQVFRGRASHAESSAGLDEYHHVSEKVEALLPRLHSLVEEVLLTKKNWGRPDMAVERLAPLRSYVKKDGVPVVAIS